jgi:hypothetical protein
VATVKQIGLRLTADDVALVDAIMAKTGHVAMSDAIRFVLRQYADANGIAPKRSKKDR